MADMTLCDFWDNVITGGMASMWLSLRMLVLGTQLPFSEESQAITRRYIQMRLRASAEAIAKACLTVKYVNKQFTCKMPPAPLAIKWQSHQTLGKNWIIESSSHPKSWEFIIINDCYFTPVNSSPHSTEPYNEEKLAHNTF